MLPKVRKTNPESVAGLLIEDMSVDEIASVKDIETEVGLSTWRPEDYVNELRSPDSVCLVVKIEGKVVAFTVARLITISNTPTFLYESELLSIGVSKKLQNQAIGTKLLTALITTLKTKSVLRIWLEVRESNRHALRFYEQKGFAYKFRRRGYYALPNEDAIVMCREILPEKAKTATDPADFPPDRPRT